MDASGTLLSEHEDGASECAFVSGVGKVREKVLRYLNPGKCEKMVVGVRGLDSDLLLCEEGDMREDGKDGDGWIVAAYEELWLWFVWCNLRILSRHTTQRRGRHLWDTAT